MIKDLVRIANTLDRLNLQREANLIDSLIKSASEDDEFSYPDYSSLYAEREPDPYEEEPQKKKLSPSLNPEEWKKERRGKIIKRDRLINKKILENIISSAEKAKHPVNLLKAYLRGQEGHLKELKSDYKKLSEGGGSTYGERDVMVILERILLSEKMIDNIQSLIDDRE